MRLIDADKLKRVYAQSPSAPLPSFVTGSEIDKAPTVKAIPVEWLLMARDKYNNHGLPKEANFINELIALWGICNETN